AGPPGKGECYATLAVTGDEVPRAARRAANEGVRSLELDAESEIGQGLGAGDVGADLVALDDGPCGSIAAAGDHDADPKVPVAGNEVARTGGGPADEAIVHGACDEHPPAVGQCRGAGDVSADLVALDDVPRGRRAAEVDENVYPKIS